MRSNAILHKLICDAVEEVAPSVGRDLIALVTTREGVDELLKLHDVIDLVIPRGSNALVRGGCVCACVCVCGRVWACVGVCVNVWVGGWVVMV